MQIIRWQIVMTDLLDIAFGYFICQCLVCSLNMALEVIISGCYVWLVYLVLEFLLKLFCNSDKVVSNIPLGIDHQYHSPLHELKFLMGQWFLESSVELLFFLRLRHGMTTIWPPSTVSFDRSFLKSINFLFELTSIAMFCFFDCLFWLTSVVLFFLVWFVFIVESGAGVCWIALISMCLRGAWFVSICVFFLFVSFCCLFVRLHLSYF